MFVSSFVKSCLVCLIVWCAAFFMLDDPSTGEPPGGGTWCNWAGGGACDNGCNTAKCFPRVVYPYTYTVCIRPSAGDPDVPSSADDDHMGIFGGRGCTATLSCELNCKCGCEILGTWCWCR